MLLLRKFIDHINYPSSEPIINLHSDEIIKTNKILYYFDSFMYCLKIHSKCENYKIMTYNDSVVNYARDSFRLYVHTGWYCNLYFTIPHKSIYKNALDNIKKMMSEFVNVKILSK